MTEKEENSVQKDTIRDCAILYKTASLPCTKTCMCWGWECGKGWHGALRSLSCQLEAMNLVMYPKYKVRIQADQVKEKYGTLRFYYSVVCDNLNWFGRAMDAVRSVQERLLDENYYKIKYVVDAKSYTTNEREELTKERYDRLKGEKFFSGRLVEEDGRYFREYELWHPQKSHAEPTRARLMYRVLNAVNRAAYRAMALLGRKDVTREQRVATEFMESAASRLVDAAEKECYGVCEKCGAQIGTSWSPRCETLGWITYVCDKCAEASDSTYTKNGEVWKGDKMIKTKEEATAERRRVEEDIGDSAG